MGIVYGCGIITVFTYSIRRVFNMRIIEMNKHDGFEILRKIDLNNISNERQGKIERLTGENLRHADRVDGEFRSEQNNNQSGGSTSAKTTTALGTDGVDIEADGDSQSRRGRDTGTGFENEQEEIKCITKVIN